MTAEQLFNSTATGFLIRWATIHSFRQVAKAGLPHAERVIGSLDTAFVRSLSTNPELKGVIEGGPLPPELETTLSSATTANTLAVARSSVDAASLVFAHALIDDAALGYCRVAAMAGPEDWEAKLLDKKVAIRDVKLKGLDHVLGELIEIRLQQLERESLIQKVECLLSCCRPPQGFRPLDGYEFSIDQLRAIDQLRHDVVHRRALGQPIPDAEANLEYLSKTGGGFFVALLAQRYGLRLDLRQQAAELTARGGGPG